MLTCADQPTHSVRAAVRAPTSQAERRTLRLPRSASTHHPPSAPSSRNLVVLNLSPSPSRPRQGGGRLAASGSAREAAHVPFPPRSVTHFAFAGFRRRFRSRTGRAELSPPSPSARALPAPLDRATAFRPIVGPPSWRKLVSGVVRCWRARRQGSSGHTPPLAGQPSSHLHRHRRLTHNSVAQPDQNPDLSRAHASSSCTDSPCVGPSPLSAEVRPPTPADAIRSRVHSLLARTDGTNPFCRIQVRARQDPSAPDLGDVTGGQVETDSSASASRLRYHLLVIGVDHRRRPDLLQCRLAVGIATHGSRTPSRARLAGCRPPLRPSNRLVTVFRGRLTRCPRRRGQHHRVPSRSLAPEPIAPSLHAQTSASSSAHGDLADYPFVLRAQLPPTSPSPAGVVHK